MEASTERTPRTSRAARALLIDYIRERHVVVDDGTSRTRWVGTALLSAFALATALVLVSHFEFGADDSYLPAGLDNTSVSVVIVLCALVLSGIFLAAVSWSVAGARRGEDRRSIVWTVAPMAVFVINAILGLSLISTAATIRTTASLFEGIPSLVLLDVDAGNLALLLGVTTLASCVAFLVLELAAPQQRLVLASLAALPAVLCAAAYGLAERTGTQLSSAVETQHLSGVSPSTIRYILAPASARVVAAPLLILVLGGAAFVALLVALGVSETVDAKDKLSRLFVGARRIRPWVVFTLVGVVAAVFVLGRFDLLPDGDEAGVVAFSATAPEAWIVAALMALGGLFVIRAATLRPLEKRNVRFLIVIACVSLVAGEIMLFLASLVQQLAEPFVTTDSSLWRLVYEWLPNWALWAASWVAFLTAIGFGLWGLWRLARNERSDRVVFALGFAVVVFPLRLTTVLLQHDAAHGIWDYRNATPDLIALTGVAIVAIAMLVRRPLFDNRTATIVVSVLFLVMLLDAVVPEKLTIGTFQVLLVAPFVYRYVFHSEDLRTDPKRAAVSVAGIGLLFVASSGAIAVGALNGEVFKVREIGAFIQLTAPLALLVLCPTVPRSTTVTTTPISTTLRRHRDRIGAGVVLAGLVFVVGALALAIVRLPGVPDRGQYQVDVRVVPDGFKAEQLVFGVGGETVQVTDNFTTVMTISHGPLTDPDLCGAESLTTRFPDLPLLEEPGRIEPVAGLPTVTARVTDGTSEITLTCGAEASGGSSRSFIVFDFDSEELSPAAMTVLEGVVFRSLVGLGGEE